MGLSDEHFYGSWERGSLNIMMVVRLSLFFFNCLGCLKCRSVALGQPENNTKHITPIGQLLDLCQRKTLVQNIQLGFFLLPMLEFRKIEMMEIHECPLCGTPVAIGVKTWVTFYNASLSGVYETNTLTSALCVFLIRFFVDLKMAHISIVRRYTPSNCPKILTQM